MGRKQPGPPAVDVNQQQQQQQAQQQQQPTPGQPIATPPTQGIVFEYLFSNPFLCTRKNFKNEFIKKIVFM